MTGDIKHQQILKYMEGFFPIIIFMSSANLSNPRTFGKFTLCSAVLYILTIYEQISPTIDILDTETFQQADYQ